MSGVNHTPENSQPVNGKTRLNLLCYNMQVAIGSSRFHHMLSHGWRYVMPHGQSISNLERIAKMVTDYDIVALNEADAGSHRTRYINQASYLKDKAGYDYCDQMITRDIGKFAQHSNSLLSRHQPHAVYRHRLPSMRDGRGILEAHFTLADKDVVVLITHLGLRRKARLSQMEYIADVIKQHSTVILMGDLNCTCDSPEMELLKRRTHLYGPEHSPATFPSWNPIRALDHILVSNNVILKEISTIHEPLSDHLALQSVVEL
jgi:endonuclease/exonuclease/phosphatase family metal-dependent hydrolase